MHSGFANAVDKIWDRVPVAIKNKPDGDALAFTGHSLGGVLAIIAAERARSELKMPQLRSTLSEARARAAASSPRAGSKPWAM